MTTTVTSGNITVTWPSSEDRGVAIEIRTASTKTTVQFDEMGPMLDLDDDDDDAAAHERARNEFSRDYSERVKSIKETGIGEIAAVNASTNNRGGGIEVRDHQATITLDRYEGIGGTIIVELDRTDTESMLEALRRFTELWAPTDTPDEHP